MGSGGDVGIGGVIVREKLGDFAVGGEVEDVDVGRLRDVEVYPGVLPDSVLWPFRPYGGRKAWRGFGLEPQWGNALLCRCHKPHRDQEPKKRHAFPHFRHLRLVYTCPQGRVSGKTKRAAVQ